MPAHDEQRMRLALRPAELLRERLDIDEAAGVAALADPALVVERLDFKADDPPLDCNDPRDGPHRCADGRRGKMADIDLGADRDPAGLEMALEAVGGSKLHL